MVEKNLTSKERFKKEEEEKRPKGWFGGRGLQEKIMDCLGALEMMRL